MFSLDEIKRPIRTEFEQYEQQLRLAVQTENPLLQTVFTHLFQQQGKQLRPLLMLLASKLCYGITDKTIKSAVAIELLHTASLIHDDVIDVSEIRRGQAAIHAKWSNKIAVLTGDYILGRVIELLAEVRNTQIFGVIASLGASLSSGELLQLDIQPFNIPTEQQYMRIITQKTANLFAACMQIGAIASGATKRQESALLVFGQEFGLAFQMKDDQLDFSDAEQVLGKPTLEDIADGKVTLPLLKTLERADKDGKQHILGLLHQIKESDDSAERIKLENEIKSLVLRYDGIGYVQQRMQYHRARAEKALEIFPASSCKTALLQILDYSLYRIF